MWVWCPSGVLEGKGKRVQQCRVITAAGGAVQCGEAVVDLGPFGFQFGEPGDDPGPQRCDRG
jgi:hypothetical protein